MSQQPQTISLEQNASVAALSSSCKVPDFFAILTKFDTARQISIKVPSLKFHGNPSRGAALIHADRRTDMRKLIGAYSGYANVLENASSRPCCELI